jgi:hypothetical protein
MMETRCAFGNGLDIGAGVATSTGLVGILLHITGQPLP